MKRIAILIVGEYRTFNECRKTMAFLDQSDTLDFKIDVYFSTWNITTIVNPAVNRMSNREHLLPTRFVSLSEIQNTLNRPATIRIHHLDDRQNNNGLDMIVGWKLGLELVKESGIEYDFMLLLRPDLFFQPNCKFNYRLIQNNYDNCLGCLKHNLESKIADDTLFFSTYENIVNILSDDAAWYNYGMNPDTQWHEYLYNHIISKNLSFTQFPIDNIKFLIGRFPMTGRDTWMTVENQYWKVFRNLST